MTTPALPPPPTPGLQKAVIDKNLQKVIEHFAKLKEEAYLQRTISDAVPWFRPEVSTEEATEGSHSAENTADVKADQGKPSDDSTPKWEGALQTEKDLIAIHKAFQTDEAEKQLIAAYTPGNAGNVGDNVVLPLQIDYMMQAERAYRARVSQSFPRAVAHVASRERGHGQPNGAFLGQALKYFTTLLKQGAD